MKSSIKWFDYQVLWHYHLIISDSAMWKRLQNVYSQMKQTRLKPLSQDIWQPPPLHPVSYQPPTHRRLLAFPVCAFIIEEFEVFLDVRIIVRHLHVYTREHSVMCTHGNTVNTVHVYTREHSEHSVAACGNNENLRGMWKQWKKTGKQFFTLFFGGFSLGSHGGVGWQLLRVATSKIIWDLCHVICLVRWIMGRIGKVGREVVKTLDYQW
jgi:hypothetical protein